MQSCEELSFSVLFFLKMGVSYYSLSVWITLTNNISFSCGLLTQFIGQLKGVDPLCTA